MRAMGARGRGARAAAALGARLCGAEGPRCPESRRREERAAIAPLASAPLAHSLARCLCASLGISVHVAGSAGRGRRKGEEGAARSDASRPREPAGSGGGGSRPRQRSVLGGGERGTGSALPALVPGGSRGSPRPRLPRRCLFLLAEMTRRLLPPENISK